MKFLHLITAFIVLTTNLSSAFAGLIEESTPVITISGPNKVYGINILTPYSVSVENAPAGTLSYSWFVAGSTGNHIVSSGQGTSQAKIKFVSQFVGSLVVNVFVNGSYLGTGSLHVEVVDADIPVEVSIHGPATICVLNSPVTYTVALTNVAEECNNSNITYNWSVEGSPDRKYSVISKNGPEFKVSFPEDMTASILCVVFCNGQYIGSSSKNITVQNGINWNVSGSSRSGPGNITFTSNQATTRWYVGGNYKATGSNFNYYLEETTDIVARYYTCSSTYEKVVTGTITLPKMEELVNENFIVTNNILVKGITSPASIYTISKDERSQVVKYYDGLGRQVQTVLVRNSPSTKDIIQPFSYDEFGREKRKILPYVLLGGEDNWGVYRPNAIKSFEQSTYTASEQYSFYQSGEKIADDTRPYSETIFEPSPLNRPAKAYGPGKDWYDKSKFVEYQYLVNEDGTATGQERVIAWTLSTSSLPIRYKNTTFNNNTGYYPTGSLTINVTKNEEGMSIREYSNKEGQVIFKKVQEVKHSPLNLNNKEYWIQTYYIYDDLGNLKFVLTPELVNKLVSSTTTNPSTTDLANFAFQYKYDERQRLIEKHVPGGGKTFMVYDKWDRLVLTQDEEQKLINKWSYTKYDVFNRPIITGIYTDSRTSSAIQAALLSATVRFETLNPQPGASSVYTNVSFPNSNTEALTATYYDNYDFLATTNWEVEGNDFSYVNDEVGYETFNKYVTGQVTGSKIRILGGSIWLNSVTYYDDYYNNIQSISEHALGGVDRISNQYDFSGKLLKTIDTHTGVENHTITQNFEYDHAGRLLKIYHKVDQEDPLLIVKNEYNELGELIDKQLHGTDASETNFLQSVDYRYNIRGWLTHINNSTVSNDGLNNDDDNDFFGMELYYNQLASGVSTSTDLLYNGNISAVKWHNDGEKGYKYKYDGANRLDQGLYFERESAWLNSGKYNVNNLDYDKNGNIRSLNRYNDSDTSPMDQLTYNYGTESAQSNRLLKVGDTGIKEEGFKDGTNTDNDYAYYLNGNLKADKNKGITEITYNHLNLPTSVTWENGQQIVYTYDATGVKLKQEVKKGAISTENYYVGNFFYTRELEEASTKHEWNFNSGKQSWNNNSHVSNFVWNSEGYVQATIVNPDPNISSPVIDIPITKNSIVKIRLKVDSDRNNAQLFFSTYASTGYSEAKSIRFNLIQGSKGFNEYILDLSDNPSWTGRLRSFRLDPIHGTTTGTFAVDYIKVIETTGVEEPQVQAIQHQEGRIMMMNKEALGIFPEYQYHIKDHLGNVRLTFTSQPETDADVATLEPVHSSDEYAEFLYYENVTKINSTLFDHTDIGPPNYSIRLNGTEKERIGLVKSLAVMPGDRIRAEVHGKYIDPDQNNWEQLLTDLIGSIINGTAPVGTVLEGAAVPAGEEFPYPDILNPLKATQTGPRAYLNYLIFDKDRNFLDGNFVSLTGGKESGTGVDHQKLETGYINIEQQGFVYIYLSNDNPQPLEVYFDDFLVEHIQTPVIQFDDYYPFGLTFNSFQRESKIGNKYLYNGKEIQDDLHLDWMDYGARMYNPEIARWHVIDALAEKVMAISPYSYVDNNPVNNIDPDGNMTVYGGNGAGYAFQHAAAQANKYYEAGMQKAAYIGHFEVLAQTYPDQYAAMVLSDAVDAGFHKRLSNINGYDNYKEAALRQFSKQKPRDMGQWKEDGLNTLWGITPFGAASNAYNSFADGNYLEGALHATTALAPFAGKFASYGAELNAVKSGSNIALGVTEHLDDFAKSVSGSTWESWGTQDFQSQFLSTINNTANKIHFNMTGPTGSMINPWKAVSEGARGLGSSRATSWELYQLYSNPGALQRTTFYFNGGIIPPPF